MKKRWTEQEEKFLIENIKTLSLQELASKLNRTVSSIADRTARILKIYRPSLEEKKPLIGEKFGYLTVISTSSKKGNEHVLCSCECGSESDVRVYSLRDGNTTSCGCGLYRMKEKGGKGNSTYKYVYRTYKRNAKKQNRNFDLTLDEFIKLVNCNCHYCGSKPKITNAYLNNKGKQKNKDKVYQQTTIDFAYAKMNGIDRVNNDLGYTKSNTVPCCFLCNRAKHSIDIGIFLQWIKTIKAHEIDDKIKYL